jgi:SAM-dependent methyltransferase
MKWFAARGNQVTGVDRSAEVLATACTWGTTIAVDLENGPWPLLHEGQPQLFGAVIVTNYLWRALFPTIQTSLAPGGILIYETFAIGNETVGKPSRPDFLLRQGELLSAFADLRLIAYEEGFIASPERFIQRIVAVKKDSILSTQSLPPRYLI